jgi:hypothetical protein
MTRTLSSRSYLIRLLVLCGIALLLIAPAAFSQGGNSQQGGLPALEKRVAALEALSQAQADTVAKLEDALAAEKAGRQAADAALATRATALENKTRYLSVSGTETLLTGTNLHIVNGLEATNGNPADPFAEGKGQPGAKTNGLGNLIVGYNEDFGNNPQRGGSHNIVVGIGHAYPSFGGLVAGDGNEINAPYATVSGGNDNIVTGLAASISGGISNRASGVISSISGGSFNRASGLYASISGGGLNTASGDSSSVSGGSQNTAFGRFSSISGGTGNSAGGFFGASVSGGRDRSVNGDFDWAAGALFEDF